MIAGADSAAAAHAFAVGGFVVLVASIVVAGLSAVAHWSVIGRRRRTR